MQAAPREANSAVSEVSFTRRQVFSCDQILIIRFGKHPKEFTEAIVDSELGRKLEEEGFDITPEWAHGAKVLISGLTSEILAKMDFSASDLGSADDLKVYHVVCRPRDEKIVMECLQKGMPYRKRPRVKSKSMIQLWWPLDVVDFVS